MSLVGKLNLSQTFLSPLCGNGEMTAIMNGKMYTLGDVCEHRRDVPTLTYNGEFFKLEEAESIRNLEQEYYLRNKEAIDKFQERNFKNLAKEDEKLREELRAREEIRRSESMEAFFINYFITIYSGMKPQTHEQHQRTPRTENVVNTDLDFEKEKHLLLSQIMKRQKHPGIVMLYGNIYTMPKSAGHTIHLESLSYVGRVDHLEKSYREKFNKNVRNRVDKNLDALRKRLSKRQKAIEGFGTSQDIPSSVKDIRFIKDGDDQYILVKKIPKHVVELPSSKYYLFPEFQIGFSIRKREREISFEERAFLYCPKDYRHPFIPKGSSQQKDICYGRMNDSSKRRAKWDIKQGPGTSKEQLAASLKRTIQHTEAIIMRGHDPTYTEVPHDDIRGLPHLSISTDEAKRQEARGVTIYTQGGTK